MRTVEETIQLLPYPLTPVLQAPRYNSPEDYNYRTKIGLAVESMKRHMTDEGWQLFQGLEKAGYFLRGKDLAGGRDVLSICSNDAPHTVVLQDKREWEGLTADKSRDPSMAFENVQALRYAPSIFKVTVLKDAQNNPEYHRESAEEIGCHAWIVYYHPKIVKHVAPYVREKHLIRTYHSLDPAIVPPFLPGKERWIGILSGAISGAYPLRQRLRDAWKAGKVQNYIHHAHPGYHRNGCQTPQYLEMLSKHKVAICTSSKFGYAVRKIIEATAAGCRVITDLPTDDVLPFIDGNLVRVNNYATPAGIDRLVKELADSWKDSTQEAYSILAKINYSYKPLGARLARDIEEMRRNYSC